MKRKVVSLMLVSAMVAGMLAGCGSDSGSSKGGSSTETGSAAEASSSGETADDADDKSPITFEYFNADGKNGNWDNPVAKAITEATGVTLDVSYPVASQGDAKEDVALMIANDEYPDMIYAKGSATDLYQAGALIDMTDLIEKYGPNRYHIVTAKDGFHGRTFGAMSATGQPGNGCQVGFGPMTYGFSYAPYNDLKAFKDACTENTIAIMIEPVQGEGGVHPATQEFIEGLRKLCDERGMLLLLDEVQTGWGRTGSPMAFMGYGVKPDCVTMAKAMGGGMPIGACCASEEVAAVFTSGTHGSTYGGHPLACAASLASISEILDRDLSGNAKVMGEYMKEKLGISYVYED